MDILLPQTEPETTADFLKHSKKITLDPNTANKDLLLSERNRIVTFMREKQNYSNHPDRFIHWDQVLSRESLTGRCYWEVEMESTGVEIAVAYKNIRRAGSLFEGGFGYNDKSWSLQCVGYRYNFCYNSIKTWFSGPLSSRVGVYHPGTVQCLQCLCNHDSPPQSPDHIHSASLCWNWGLLWKQNWVV